MSTEKSPLLVVGWLESDAAHLTIKLLPISEHFNIEHDSDDLPNILVEDYDYLFTNNMTKDFRKFCQENEIELVSGADNNESGDWYFGFGIPASHKSSTMKLAELIEKLELVIKKTIGNVDISEPETHNVIYWF
jgi:hypothetical protein